MEKHLTRTENSVLHIYVGLFQDVYKEPFKGILSPNMLRSLAHKTPLVASHCAFAKGKHPDAAGADVKRGMK